MMRLSLLLGASLLLSACSLFDDEDKADKDRLPGDRISVLESETGLSADDTTAGEEITIPIFAANNAWQQVGGGVVNNQGNLAIRSTEVTETVSVGEGYDWQNHLVAQPIVAKDRIFAMDGRGYISAHPLKDIDERLWVSDALVEEDEKPMIGGGLAYVNDVIYVTSGYGRIIALNANDGTKIWGLSQGIPIRAAPRVVNGWLLAVTVDNQTLAVNTRSGQVVWSHRGISESAGFLASIAPAIIGESVVAPYSSGELVALDIATGTQRWSDTIASTRRTSALSRFTGITALPIVHDGVVYSLHASGIAAAHVARNGATLWERKLSSHHTPWIVGKYMALITRDDELVMLRHRDGQIVWVKPLKREYSDEKWLSPVVAGNHILVGSTEGTMRVYNHKDGSVVTEYDIPDDVATDPVIAQGGMYLLTEGAVLHGLY